MSRAVLSAGSNVGDRLGHLAAVVAVFAEDLVALSSVYATPPWGGVEQDDFYNITLIVDGPSTPEQWLERGAELEQAAQRVRDIRWGPRTLDVDVIDVTDTGADGVSTTVISDDPVLTLPHPRAAQRAFVLIPWLEIDPAATLWTAEGVTSVADLVGRLDESERRDVRAVDTIEWTRA